jgi:hypothetical protein
MSGIAARGGRGELRGRAARGVIVNRGGIVERSRE